MNIGKSDIIGKIRTAIDDIAPSATDSFSTNTDDELWQAVQHAVNSLLQEAPLDMLLPKADASHYASPGGDQYHIKNADGSGYLILESDYVRFVSFALSSWNGRTVTELVEPGSDEALRQNSSWSKGSVTKPRLMLDYDASGQQILRYWTAGLNNNSYDHTVTVFNYIPKATIASNTINCALKDIAEPMIIYQAAAIFFEGKKESETAEKFRNI